MQTYGDAFSKSCCIYIVYVCTSLQKFSINAFFFMPFKNIVLILITKTLLHGRIRRGWAEGPDPLKNTKLGLLSKTGPDPMKNYKATKPEFNVRPSSARQRNAIEMAFRWLADDGPDPLLVVFGSSLLSTKKTLSKLDPFWQKFWIRACTA